ncbi:hypothetical protein [Sulfurimonas sp.]|uniref:hypothetical protein n=1 Tax=Sulfurimonas sp. TaxID=2022749 RepID=UPI003565362D
MIIDVNVSECDESFVEDLEDIIEDTMVQMFVLHPKDVDSLENVQELANEHNTIFYTTPADLSDQADTNCVGICISKTDDLASIDDRVVFVDEAKLDDTLYNELKNHKGIILNATKSHDELENFFVSIGPGCVEEFDKDILKNIPMEKMVLQSNYPKHGFNDIYTSMETISEATLRAEMSIAAEATKNTMKLFAMRRL